jgi:6-pyruvoyltetrahydropterin/6-carboxytetrahydropterin synthase
MGGMMFDLKVQGSFSAAHQVKGYPGDCAGVHGHTYRVSITIRKSKLGKIGMAVDFRRVHALLKDMLKKLDHKNLNTLTFFKKHNATAEWIAVYIHQEMKKKIASLRSVTVWEGLNDAVTYQED